MATHSPPRRPIVGSLEGMAISQNINRRGHQRTVPMKLLCFGLSRSGTSSLRQALLDLGYADVYHFASILNENPPDAELWLEALDCKQKGEKYGRRNWDALLGHCEAVTDTPVVWFWEDLLESYPEAKVIVTVRDSPKQWFDSQMNTLMRYMRAVVLPAPSMWRSFCSWFLPTPGKVEELSKRMATEYEMFQLLAKDSVEGTREAEKFYERHVEEVKRRVPKERLLVMNVKEGCEFCMPSNLLRKWIAVVSTYYADSVV